VRKKTKFLFLRVSVILAFAVLAGRLWYVQVVMGSYYKQQADTSKIRLEPVQALRGIIYDQKGRQLVWNTPSWNVEIVPHGIPYGRGAAIYARLAQLLKNQPTAAEIAQTVAANQWRDYAPALIKPNVSADVAMVIKQLHATLPGVRADPSSVRGYRWDPQNSLSHLLGYTVSIGPNTYAADRRLYPAENFLNSDQVGSTGIEAQVDPYLHGINGTEQVEVDAGERPVRVLKKGTSIPGDNVYLTVDSKVQKQVAQDLGAALAQLHLRKGVAILEDVHTGKIISIVSLPSYNNDWFSNGISAKRYASLLSDPAHPLNDIAISGQYPPGSTFKVVTAAAALGTGVADVNRYIDDTGYIKLCSVYNPLSCRVFNGWQPGGLGSLNVVGALARSSDIYFYTVAGGNPNKDPNMPKIGGDRLAAYARRMGLGSPTGIDLPGEMPGLVPSKTWFDHLPVGPLRNAGETWHIGNDYNMAIGQGQDWATPLQMVNVAATIANGGTLLRPRVVDHISGTVIPQKGALATSQVLQPFVPSIVRHNVISPDNLALIQQGMHMSVTPLPYGTSWNVVDPRINAAGKTGTAEDSTGNGAPDAWWIGYAPFNHPQVAVCVLVPNANAEGAYVAAPIAHKVLEDYFHLAPLKKDWLVDVQQMLVPSAGGTQ
jgi:penicillin-binding protein 2